MAAPSSIKSLPPVDEVQEGPYDITKSKAPVLTGLPLRLFLSVVEGPLSGPVMSTLFRMNNYTQVGGAHCSRHHTMQGETGSGCVGKQAVLPFSLSVPHRIPYLHYSGPAWH